MERQSLFFGSHLDLLGGDDAWTRRDARYATAYFHGRPGSGEPEFDQAFENLQRYQMHIDRIQVSHSEMRDIVLGAGIAPEKVFLIPIGINLDFFPLATAESRRAARQLYGIPESAVVIGSFQKDGVGWGKGMEPKRIKGPDIFLRAMEILRARMPELFVFLSGPARGYVKTGLERLGIPYRHCYVSDYQEIGRMFHALDVYVVASRQEGGPKAVLEAMASGIALVTTRVGQAMDLVRHGDNGWMVEVEDAEGLAHWAECAIRRCGRLQSVLSNGRNTAMANSYNAQATLWRSFLDGFVELNPTI